MCYFSQDDKKAIAPKVKEILNKHGLKGSLSVRDNSTVVLTVKSGSIDFGSTHQQVNVYWTNDHYKGNQKALDFFNEILPVMNTGNYDNSDIMTDFHDKGFYVSINIGNWDKPYQITK